MREYRDPEYEKVVVRAFALGGIALLTAIVVSLVWIGRTLSAF
jgi:hypothetical protein